MYQPYKKKYQAYISNDGHDLMQKAMMLLLFLLKKVITEFMFWYISKGDAINIMKNSDLNEKNGLLQKNFCCFNIRKKTYYRRNREKLLNRAKKYYENTKERLREQAQSKYIDSLTKKKIKKENIGEIDIKMSQEDK